MSIVSFSALAVWPPARPADALPWALLIALLGFALWRELRARRIAERLREAEARLQAAVESLPFDFWVMDADGRYSVLNAAAIRRWGNHMGKRVEELDLPAETVARWQESNRRAFAGQTVRGDVTYHQGGQHHICKSIVAPVLHRGAVRGILGVNIDVTDLKLATKAYRQSEVRFRALVEHSSDAIALFSATGEIVYASAASARVFGSALGDLIGHNAFEFIHPGDHASVERQLRDAMARPAVPVPWRARVRDRDGAIRLLSGTCTDLLGDPAVAGIVCNCRDITESAAAEAALRDSEARFQAFMNHSPTVIFMKDPDLRYIHVNRRFERAFGMRRDDILGRTDSEIFPADQARAFEENDRRALTENRAIEVEESARYLDGVHVSIVMKFPLRDAEGRAVALCGIAADITERRQLEDQLRQAQRMDSIGQLAGGVAHDFNNLLTVIQGHTSLIEVSPGLAPEVTESVQQIMIASERAANLTRQLLVFSRRQFMVPRQIDLNEVVGEMAKMLRRVLGEDIALQFQPGLLLPPIHADPGMIEHVLLNLALNARDAMPRGGRLIVATEHRHFVAGEIPSGTDSAPGLYVLLRVSDNGTGISAEHLAHIFEPFFTTKTVGKGTGLGLATVFGIVKQHRGWIDVATGPGGSSFAVHLSATPPTMSPAAPLFTAPPTAGRRQTLLVVEDDASLRGLVCRLLIRLGYHALEAESAAAATAIWRDLQGQVDLVLTDVVLPGGVNGREFADALRAERPDLPVIFTSGYQPDDPTRDTGLPPEATVLRKPYHPDELATAIRAALEQTEAAK